MHLVGLDIGGSKTHAISRTDRGDRDFFSGTANLASVGDHEAGRQLDLVLEQLRARTSEPITAVCAGAAGVDTPEAEARLRALFQSRVPGAAVRIVHDTHLILAAAGVDAGIAVISGTGSAAYGLDATGRNTRAGGWGYLLGDEGGGYAIARAAVRHALHRSDQGRPVDRLTSELVTACGQQRPDQLLDHFYATPERRYWAAHARVVFALADQQDPAAAGIVTAAAADLADLVRTVATALNGSPGPVVLAGGVLVHQPRLRQALADALVADGLRDFRVLDRAPAVGAVLLAAQLTHSTDTPAPDKEASRDH